MALNRTVSHSQTLYRTNTFFMGGKLSQVLITGLVLIYQDILL